MHTAHINLELSESSRVGVTVYTEENINTINEVSQHLLQQPNPQLQQVHDPNDSHVMYPRRSRTLCPDFVIALQMPHQLTTSNKPSFCPIPTSSKL